MDNAKTEIFMESLLDLDLGAKYIMISSAKIRWLLHHGDRPTANERGFWCFLLEEKLALIEFLWYQYLKPHQSSFCFEFCWWAFSIHFITNGSDIFSSIFILFQNLDYWICLRICNIHSLHSCYYLLEIYFYLYLTNIVGKCCTDRNSFPNPLSTYFLNYPPPSVIDLMNLTIRSLVEWRNLLQRHYFFLGYLYVFNPPLSFRNQLGSSVLFIGLIWCNLLGLITFPDLEKENAYWRDHSKHKDYHDDSELVQIERLIFPNLGQGNGYWSD